MSFVVAAVVVGSDGVGVVAVVCDPVVEVVLVVAAVVCDAVVEVELAVVGG